MRGVIAQWPIWRMSGGKAYAVLIGVWLILGRVLAPVSDRAYFLSIVVSFAGPTALFCFIFARHWFLPGGLPAAERTARRIGCIAACGVTSWLAVETARLYTGMSDAPRGLIWDVHIAIAPLLGGGVQRLVRAIAQRSLR
jgi:hypothetical protein